MAVGLGPSCGMVLLCHDAMRVLAFFEGMWLLACRFETNTKLCMSMVSRVLLWDGGDGEDGEGHDLQL